MLQQCLLILICWRSVFAALMQISTEDQCVPINTTTPPKCPDLYGPPCPPCIVNTAPDYQIGDEVVISSSTQKKIEFYINKYLQFWLQNSPPSKLIPATSPSYIGDGAAGRSLLFLRMYNYTLNITYLNIASQYIRYAVQSINISYSSYCSYFSGNVGVYIVAAQISKFQNNTKDLQLYVDLLSDIFKDVETAINANLSKSSKYGYNMFDAVVASGLSGLLYAEILFVEYFGKNVIPNMIEYITNLCHYLIEIGIKRGEKYGLNYLVYEMPFSHEHANACYLSGAADGSGGVIKMLLEAYNRGYVPDIMTNIEYKTAITNTLNWEVSIQLNDGNMPTWSSDVNWICRYTWAGLDMDSNYRVQWCNGAPSFIETYGLAAVVYDSIGDNESAQMYLQHAIMAFNATWKRGLLFKGLSQCHGIGGNTYALLHLFKNLQIISKLTNSFLNNVFNVSDLLNQSLWRAIQFVEFTLDQNNINVLADVLNYSMWRGNYGIVTLYIQAIQPGWPKQQPVCMIAWDFCGV